MNTPIPITSAAESARILTLEGGCNFRDLGGYRTRDGRTIKWGKVYRTAVLSYFTANDHPALSQLRVRAICDLRRAEERQREPTRWPDATTKQLSWEDGSAPPTLRDFAANYPFTAAGVHTAMIDLYRALPQWLAPRLHGIFTKIAEGEVPLIVHCAAGKDRTGIAIALLLAVLKVPHETIIADYLLTNDAGDFEQFILSQPQLAASHHPLLELPEDVRRVIFAAHADYLQAAFDQINRDYEGIDAFLNRQGIDAAMRARVQEHLLT